MLHAIIPSITQVLTWSVAVRVELTVRVLPRILHPYHNTNGSYKKAQQASDKENDDKSDQIRHPIFVRPLNGASDDGSDKSQRHHSGRNIGAALFWRRG